MPPAFFQIITPEVVLSATAFAQVLYLAILAVGVITIQAGCGLRLPLPGKQVSDEFSADDFQEIYSNRAWLTWTFIVLVGTSLAIPALADFRGALITGNTGILSPKAAVFLLFGLNLFTVSILVHVTGGPSKSIFTGALTFLPTACLFVTRSFWPGFSLGVLVILSILLEAGRLADRGNIRATLDKHNPQVLSGAGPALSVAMRILFLIATLYVAYRNAFGAL